MILHSNKEALGITLFESELYGGGVKMAKDNCSPTLRANKVCAGVIEIEDIVIGGEQKHQAIKTDGICTTLTSSMGTGGGMYQ